MTTNPTHSPQLFNGLHARIGFNIFDAIGKNVRTVEKDGGLWFVAKDVAKTLGYSRTSDAIRRHCKKANDFRPRNLAPHATALKIIPESDVYRLIIRSRLPEAQRFENWLFDEVLPSIRKHGCYATPMTVEQMIEDPGRAIDLLKKLKAEQAQQVIMDSGQHANEANRPFHNTPNALTHS